MKHKSIFARFTPWKSGIIGAGLLLGLYFITLSLANSPGYAVSQFKQLWYWFLPLIIGFGIQLGLYSHIRRFEHFKIHGARAGIAASSGVSAGSMIACCLHHVADILPVLGLSAAAIFLAKYQVPFIILGIVSNLIGITMMLVLIQDQNMYQKKWHIFKINMKVLRGFVLIIGAVFTIMAFLLTR